MKLKGEPIEMLKLVFPGGQQYAVEEWVVDFADEEMRWKMWMKFPHYQTPQCASWPFSFRARGTE